MQDIEKVRKAAYNRERNAVLSEQAAQGWFPRNVGLRHKVYGPRIKAAVEAAVAAAQARNEREQRQRASDGAWIKRT